MYSERFFRKSFLETFLANGGGGGVRRELAYHCANIWIRTVP